MLLPRKRRVQPAVMARHAPLLSTRPGILVPVAKSKKGHPATWPERLVEPMVLAGSRPGDCIVDPFSGTGTTGAVAKRLGRQFVGVDIDANWHELASTRSGIADLTP